MRIESFCHEIWLYADAFRIPFVWLFFVFFWTLLYALFSPFDTDFRHFNHCYTSSAGKWNLEMLKQKEMKDLSTRAVFLLDLFFVFHSSLIWANCPLLYLFGYFKQKIFCSCLFAVCLQFTAASFMHTNMEITKCEKKIWFCILFLRHFHRNIFQWNQYNAFVFFLCQSSWLLWLWLWFRLWVVCRFLFLSLLLLHLYSGGISMFMCCVNKISSSYHRNEIKIIIIEMSWCERCSADFPADKFGIICCWVRQMTIYFILWMLFEWKHCQCTDLYVCCNESIRYNWNDFLSCELMGIPKRRLSLS